MHSKDERIKIFIINLKKSTERRIDMSRKMDLYALDYEFFDGVDGKDLPDELLHKIRNQPYSFKKAFGREMTPGEIGCGMSHLNLYKKIVEEQIEMALIFEDDIDFEERLQFVLNNRRTVEVLKNDLDLVLFGYSADGVAYKEPAEVSIFKKRKIGRGISFCLPTLWNWSTIGYLISNSGAQKLLKEGLLPRMPADFLTANSPKYDVRLGIVNEPLIWPGELDRVSHIGGGRGHPNELKNVSTRNESDDVKKIPFVKQVYRSTRTRYNKIKGILYNQWLKVNPKHYLYVSDKF